MSEKNIIFSDFKYDKNINNYSTDFITKYLNIFSKQIKKYLEYYYNKLYKEKKEKINFEKEEIESKKILLKYSEDKKYYEYYKTDNKNFDDFKLYINCLVTLFTEFTKNLSNKYIINCKYLYILKSEILLLRNEFAHRNNATIELVLRFFENLYFFNKYINIIEIEIDLLEEWTKKELQFIIHSYLDINLQIDSFKIKNENILTSYKKHLNNEINLNCKNWNKEGMEKIINEIKPDKIKIKLDYNNSDNEEDNDISYKNSNDDNDNLEKLKISNDSEENEDEEEKKNENKNIDDNKINNNNNIKSLNIK